MNRSVTVIYLYAIYIKITSFFKALEWGEKVLNAYKTLWHDFLKQIRSAYSSWYSPMMLTFIKRLSNIFFWKSNFSLVVSLSFHKSKRSFCLYPDFLFTLVLNSMIPAISRQVAGAHPRVNIKVVWLCLAASGRRWPFQSVLNASENPWHDCFNWSVLRVRLTPFCSLPTLIYPANDDLLKKIWNQCLKHTGKQSDV